MTAAGEVAEEVARVARVLAAAGLVEAFGHVSARISSSDFAISSTRPLHRCRPEDVHVLGVAEGEHAGTVPLEAPLHAAIYRARDDVAAICRFHGLATAAWSARDASPPRLHGLGLMAGEVAWCPDSNLVTDRAAAARAVAALGEADCLILRANGALATGPGLERAAVRAFFLEQRCRVALDAAGRGRPLSQEEIRARSRWTEAEAGRAWTWLASREP